MSVRLERESRQRCVLFGLLFAAALSALACGDATADSPGSAGAAGAAPEVALLSSALRCSNRSQRNPCGGCRPSRHQPGELCSAGSGACATIGTYQCTGSGDAAEPTCNAEPQAPSNACGGCFPSPHQPGELCSAGSGACVTIGTYRCTGSGESAEPTCDAEPLSPSNACGGCLPSRHQPGELCSVGSNSCVSLGVYRCTGHDDSAEPTCDAEPLSPYNACGGCAPLEGAPGSACTHPNGRAGIYVCEGDAEVVCR